MFPRSDLRPSLPQFSVSEKSLTAELAENSEKPKIFLGVLCDLGGKCSCYCMGASCFRK